MKKLAIGLVFLLMTVSAGAQISLGGSIGLRIRDSRLALNLSPDIGYRINSSMVVGTSLSYYTGADRFGVSPYYRWMFLPIGNTLRLFVTASAPMWFGSDYRSIGAIVRPGAAIRLVDMAYLAIHIGAFGFNSVTTSAGRTSGWVGQMDRDSVSIGVYFYL